MTRTNGQVVLEASMGLSIAILLVVTSLEIGRRAQLDAMLWHGAFRFVRMRTLGSQKAAAAREIRSWFSQIAPAPARIRFDSERLENGAEAKLWIRYPQWLVFQGKHHFESTRACRF